MAEAKIPIFGGAFVVETREIADERGSFFEAYREDAMGLTFVQGNISVSRRAVIRGLHYQVKNPQGKFLRTLRGRTFNAIVDMRFGSSTLGKAGWLTLDRPRIGLWVPPGFANGIAALEDDTVLSYETTTYYDGRYDRALFAFDPSLNIPWPDEIRPGAILSAKDRAAQKFGAAELVPLSEWAGSQ